MNTEPETGTRQKRSKISIKDLMDAGMLREDDILLYSGRPEIQAIITPHGTLRFRGTEYTSPSGAAHAVRGSSVNGWAAWYTKTPEDEILSIGDLRKRLES